MSYQQFGHVDPEERLDHAEELEPEEEYPRRRLLPAAALGAGVLALFVGGLWFAYHQGTKHASAPSSVATTGGGATEQQVPLIRASADPVKVKPKDAGGMTLGDRDDLIYAMRPNGAQAEHILPPPEAPAPRPTAPPPPPPPQMAALPPQAFPPPLPAPGPPGTAARPIAKPGAEAAAKPPEAKPATAGPPTKIQLASLRSPDEAREEWTRLKRENADLLGKFTAVAVKADLGERGIWYRVEAGPVGDKASALKLCKALRERDLGCQLVQ